MKKIWIMIQSDPKKSHRVCEGLRIALGLAAGGHSVSVHLTQKAVDFLRETGADFIDEEHLEKFWEVFKRFIPVFLIEETELPARNSGKFNHRIKALSQEAIALKLYKADVFFRF